MRIRPTARLLVLGDRQRLLLCHIHDSEPLHEGFPDMTIYWCTLHERFFLVSVPNASVSFANITAYEQKTYCADHWWTRLELGQSREWFVPPALARFLTPLLGGDIPASPVYLHAE